MEHSEPEYSRIVAEVGSCTACRLHHTRTRAVAGEGNIQAEVMFIGEGPGFNEDQQGRPFVGRAGQFLNQLIEIAGLRRPDVYITNVVKCRPPENRDPMPVELAACKPFLLRQIQLINPRVIVTLGRYSLATFLPDQPIARVHGTVRDLDGRSIFPMYHPAAALHQEKYRQVIIHDMQTLAAWLPTPADGGTNAADGVLAETPAGPGDDPARKTQLSLF